MPSSTYWICFVVVYISVISHYVVHTCPVPADSGCSCQNGPANQGRVINCQDAGLMTIPKFTPSNEIFYEITFRNRFDPTTTPSSQCRGCNMIASLPPNAFSGLRVKVLDLSRNPLSVISNIAFSGLESVLEEIVLEGNIALSPPYTALAPLRNLRSLSLKYFNQSFISRENTKFETLQNLETLMLKNMNLEYIQSNAFLNRLPNLQRLELDYLPLKNFPFLALQTLKNLKYLSAVYLDIQDIPVSSFMGLDKLEELVLSHNNNLGTLYPGSFSGIERSLKKLGLQLNKLDQQNVSTLSTLNWQNLKQLNLGHNSLTGIPRGLFNNMRSLTDLYLDSNLLTTIDVDDLRGLDSLTFLDLSYNQLDTITPGAFYNTPSLRELDLRGENTNILSKPFLMTASTVQGLEPTLQKLVLTDTLLVESAVWSAVQRLSELVILELGGTGLKEVPDFQFVNNKNLTYLMLEKNQIAEVTSKKLFGLKNKLQVLNLQNNKIKVMDKCTLQLLNKLEMLYLGGNPLDCSCDAIALYDWILQQSQSNPLLRYVVNSVCKTPVVFQNMMLQSLNRDALQCDSTRTEKPCEDYTDAITTARIIKTVTTTTPTVTISLDSSAFHFVKKTESENSVEFLWEVRNIDEISGYVLDYQRIGSFESKSVRIPRSSLSFELNGLQNSSRYLFCLTVMYKDSNQKSIRPCMVVSTI